MSIQKEYEGKTVTDATIEACKDLGINREDLNFEVISEGTTGLLGIGGRNAVIKILNQDANEGPSTEAASASLEPIKLEKLEEIFNQIINHFVDDSSIEVETNDRNVLLKLKSDSNLGFLIGKKGEMIKNIEFLLSRVASKENSESIFVSIDINSFREKKDKELVDRVVTLIDKVISCLLYTSPSPRDRQKSRMPSSA